MVITCANVAVTTTFNMLVCSEEAEKLKRPTRPLLTCWFLWGSGKAYLYFFIFRYWDVVSSARNRSWETFPPLCTERWTIVHFLQTKMGMGLIFLNKLWFSCPSCLFTVIFPLLSVSDRLDINHNFQLIMSSKICIYALWEMYPCWIPDKNLISYVKDKQSDIILTWSYISYVDGFL